MKLMSNLACMRNVADSYNKFMTIVSIFYIIMAHTLVHLYVLLQT